MLQQAQVTPDEDAARRERYPLGASLAFADLEEAGGEAALDRLRDAEPVSWVPALGGWLVTGHAEVRQMLSPRAGTTVEAEENLVRASLGPMMLTTDGDEHARLRAPFERPFRMRDVGELFGEAIAAEAGALLDGLVPAGHCELGAGFAAPFAVRMTGRVLGLSLDDVARIDGFYSAFAGAMVYDGDPGPQRLADAARGELNAVLHADLARCRRTPDASITSEVSNDPGPGVDDDETVAQLRVIMFGGIETIQAAIMNTLLLLLRDPAQLEAVRADRRLLANAVEESLRLIPPVAFIERWTAGPTTIGEVDLGPGEFLGASVLAANRDPKSFPDPLRYDVRRENARRHLAFSFGEHFCLGAHLARLEIAEALGLLLDRLPGLRLVACEEPAGFAFRRPAALELAWGG
jgi:cytochrome P450